MRRTGGPRPEVIQDLEDRERDLAGRTASMTGADFMMPPIDHRVVDDSEEKMELGASSIGAEDNGITTTATRSQKKSSPSKQR